MDNSKKYRLSEFDIQRIFENKIKPRLFKNAQSVISPTAIILGGQPGAGKSIAANMITQELESLGSSVMIAGDDLRGHHPYYDFLMTVDDKNAAILTNDDVGIWVNQAIDYARKMHYNIVMEGTMRAPEKVSAMIKMLKEEHYTIDIRIIAVNPKLSWQSVLRRYEEQKRVDGHGRMVVPEVHADACSGLLETLEKIEHEKLADCIKIYVRGNTIIYENQLNNGTWQNTPSAKQAVENERNREWTLPERIAYAKKFDALLMLLQHPERNATETEINHVKTLRSIAYQATESEDNTSIHEDNQFLLEPIDSLWK